MSDAAAKTQTCPTDIKGVLSLACPGWLPTHVLKPSGPLLISHRMRRGWGGGNGGGVVCKGEFERGYMEEVESFGRSGGS